MSGGEACLSYCPIHPNDTMPTLALPAAARERAAVRREGRTLRHWHWVARLFRVVPMQTYDFYAAQADAPAGGASACNHSAAGGGGHGCTLPVFSTSAITPYGRAPIGHANTTWRSVTVGPPPARKFAIKNVDTCERAPHCGTPAWQHHRLVARQPHSFYEHLELPDEE